MELLPAALDSVFSAFSDNLLTFLGVHRLPPDLRTLLPVGHNTLTEWQIHALLCHRSLENAEVA